MNLIMRCKILVLVIMLSGCDIVALRDAQQASDKGDMTLQAEYARFVIGMQTEGAKTIPSFDQWLTGEYKDLSEYGKYYDICKQRPDLNKGGPLDYKVWIKTEPRPVAKENRYLLE